MSMIYISKKCLLHNQTKINKQKLTWKKEPYILLLQFEAHNNFLPFTSPYPCGKVLKNIVAVEVWVLTSQK